MLKIEEFLHRQSLIDNLSIEIIIKYLRRFRIKVYKARFKEIHNKFINKLFWLQSAKYPGYCVFMDFRLKNLS